MARRGQCPGTDMLAPWELDENPQPCPACGRAVNVNDDAGIARHPMRYADLVAHAAEIVTGMERGPWDPIWAQTKQLAS